MPGTPMNQENRELEKLQIDDQQNGQERDDQVEEERRQQQQQRYRPEPGARELTQTDKLNKRLLESLLERMSKLDGEFDRYMDKREENEETENLNEDSSDF